MNQLPLHKMFVDGKPTDALSGKTFEIENPATGEPVARVPEGDKADIDNAIDIATSAFKVWGQMPGEIRSDILNKAAAILAVQIDDFVRVEVSQTGRPIREMTSQLARLPEWFKYYAALIRTHEDTVPPFGGDYINYTQRVPLGVVGQITPWNHPLLILVKKVAPALAAGNTIVVKPSEIAPLTPLMLGAVFKEAGLPDGAYNVITGFGAGAGKSLCVSPGICKIDITGGTDTGKLIASLAGANLTQVSAELGGKAAVIVFDDVDTEEIVSAALFAGFIATGQTCVQGARLLVPRARHDEIVARLVQRAQKIIIGDPTDPMTSMGPMVSARQLALTERYVEIGKQEGAVLASGGNRPSGPEFGNGHFYQPTIFSKVTNEMIIAQEEIFGPVICVMPYDTEDEAIAIANGTEFGLATSIWTRDIRRGHRVAGKLDCGIVWINDHHRIDPASPWGGFKASGLGRENGIAAYHGYTQIRNIIINTSNAPFDWYAEDAQNLRYS